MFYWQCHFSVCSWSSVGCHDTKYAYLQSYDAIWFRPDTPTCPEHQQFVYTGGTAEAATATSTAGKYRYNDSYFLESEIQGFYFLLNFYQYLICIEYMFGGKLLFRDSWNIRNDPTAFPFPSSCRHNNHSATRKYATIQHPTDSYDPNYTSHTSFRELWDCTTATVC